MKRRFLILIGAAMFIALGAYAELCSIPGVVWCQNIDVNQSYYAYGTCPNCKEVEDYVEYPTYRPTKDWARWEYTQGGYSYYYSESVCNVQFTKWHVCIDCSVWNFFNLCIVGAPENFSFPKDPGCTAD